MKNNYKLMSVYSDDLKDNIVVNHRIFGNVSFDYNINNYYSMRYLSWRFSDYSKISEDINNLNFSELEEFYENSLEVFFLSIVEYIYQQLVQLENEVEKYNQDISDLTDEGLKFYNYWKNKIKGA
jgi:hypothetical protein